MSKAVDATISVITINRGRDAHLARLLEGVERQSGRVECIVIEIGGTSARTEGRVRRIPFAASGMPLAKARNAGARHASSDILVFLDVDCIPSADLVASLAEAVRGHDGLVCCQVLYLPEDRVGEGWTEPELIERGQPHPARSFPPRGTITEIANAGLFWSLAFAVRATTFQRLGGFDEAFDGYGAEDTDLAFRAVALGIPILFTGSGRAFHQRHEGFDPPLQHVADIARNAVLFHRRHGFWPMRDWLETFAAMGLVRLHDDGHIELVRLPSSAEVEHARLPATRAF